MVNIKENEKIAVIILRYLGDVVNTTGVFKCIKNAVPSVNLSIITLPSSIPAVKGIPEIDNVYTFDKNVKHSVWETIKFAVSLRKKFDTVIVLDNSLRSAYLAYFTGAKRRIGRVGELKKLFLNNVIPYLEEEKNMKIPVSEHYARCLKPLGIYNENIDTYFEFSSDDEEYVDKLLNEYGLNDKKLIGICPACHKEDKSMKFDDIKSLIKEINKENKYKVIIVGGKDISHITHDLKADNSVEFYDFTGKTAFTRTAALIDKCSKFISVDTSCMHLALARKIPTIALFFSNAYKKWGPKDLTYNTLYVNEDSRDTDIDEVMRKLNTLDEKQRR